MRLRVIKGTPACCRQGYRKATRSGIGSKLELTIPRDRMGVFQPVILGLLNEQEEKIKDLCFELYGKGLTTRQIEDVIENIYGSKYSKSSISRITTDFSVLVDSWWIESWTLIIQLFISMLFILRFVEKP